MEDIKITTVSSKEILVVAQTVKAIGLFQDCEFGECFKIETAVVAKVVSWAISHSLTIDSEVYVIIPKQK